MEKFQFFPLHCPSRNAISSKVFNEFSKTFFCLKDEESVYCGWKFQVRRYSGFAMATIPLFQHPENVKFSIFPFRLSQRKWSIFKSIYRNFKNFFSAERPGKWLLCLKISSAQIFWLCNSNVTTFPTSRKCKNFNFIFTISQQKCCIFKSI